MFFMQSLLSFFRLTPLTRLSASPYTFAFLFTHPILYILPFLYFVQ